MAVMPPSLPQETQGAAPEENWWRIFGDLVAVPPKRGSFDLARMRERRKTAGIKLTREQARGMMKSLDELREDRF